MDDAFAARIAGHRRSLVAYAYACGHDLDLAEDLAQEAVVIALRERERYFAEADLGAWLIAIVRNLWFRERTRRGRRRHDSAALHDLASDLFTADDDGMDWDGERRALAGCLASLPPGDRALIDGRFADDADYQTLAQRHARSLVWVKVRMHRLRTGLLDCVRRHLRQEARDGR